MKSIPSSRSSGSSVRLQTGRSWISSEVGFTVAETLVASVLGLMVSAMTLSFMSAHHFAMTRDSARTRVNQNLRGTLDIMGADLRVTGENLGKSFPAIEVTNGAGSAPDQLILRRNLVDDVLPLCTALTAGTSITKVYFAIPGSVAGCTYSGQTHAYTSWEQYRTTHGGSVKAFIYDTSGKHGQFFTYQSATNGGTSYYLNRDPGTWTYTYPTASSAVYILEEWSFRLTNGMIELTENQTNISNVSFGMTDMQVQVLMQDGTTKNSFTRSDAWTSILGVNLALAASENYAGRTIARRLSGRFFPRNILSN